VQNIIDEYTDAASCSRREDMTDNTKISSITVRTITVRPSIPMWSHQSGAWFYRGRSYGLDEGRLADHHYTIDCGIYAEYAEGQLAKYKEREVELAEAAKRECEMFKRYQAVLDRLSKAEAELQARATQKPSTRMFRMSGGPDVSWEMGRALFAGYTAFNGLCYKTVEELHGRGGLGWAEVQFMWTEKRKGERFKEAFYAAIRGEKPAAARNLAATMFDSGFRAGADWSGEEHILHDMGSSFNEERNAAIDAALRCFTGWERR